MHWYDWCWKNKTRNSKWKVIGMKIQTFIKYDSRSCIGSAAQLISAQSIFCWRTPHRWKHIIRPYPHLRCFSFVPFQVVPLRVSWWCLVLQPNLFSSPFMPVELNIFIWYFGCLKYISRNTHIVSDSLDVFSFSVCLTLLLLFRCFSDGPILMLHMPCQPPVLLHL